MFALEGRAVGPRLHGTAMASAVVNGDLQGPALPSLGRLVHFVSVMYAPPEIDAEEMFPDRLPADLFNEAIVRMKVGADASAPHVIIVNASLGDRNKPYSGRMSGWARVIDYLSHRYGIVFIISAGNHVDDLVTNDLDIIAFEALTDADKAKVALRASGAAMAYRRVLAPAERAYRWCPSSRQQPTRSSTGVNVRRLERIGAVHRVKRTGTRARWGGKA
jgi:hypothetical protein